MLNLDPTYSFVMRKSSVVDPDPHSHGCALILIDSIRIGNVDPDPDPGGLK
jgi:hypothetical protein